MWVYKYVRKEIIEERGRLLRFSSIWKLSTLKFRLKNKMYYGQAGGKDLLGKLTKCLLISKSEIASIYSNKQGVIVCSFVLEVV